MEHPLHNVIFTALGTRQREFALDAGEARRFQPDVAPLSGLADPLAPESWNALASLIPEGRGAGLFLHEIVPPQAGLTTAFTRPLVQMLCRALAPARRASDADERAAQAADLGPADAEAMIALVKLTQPGPMERRTVDLGHYIGVRDEAGHLVAMAGERLQVDGFTEISAVCTHPDHRGRGLAAALMRRLMRDVFARGEQPFLHVAADNEGALRVYRELGFAERQRAHLVAVTKPVA